MHFGAPDGNTALWSEQFAVLEWQSQCSLIHRTLESCWVSSEPAIGSCKFGQIRPDLGSPGELTMLAGIAMPFVPRGEDILFWICGGTCPSWDSQAGLGTSGDQTSSEAGWLCAASGPCRTWSCSLEMCSQPAEALALFPGHGTSL